MIEEIKNLLFDVNSETRSYLENSLAFYKLKSFKIFMKGVSALIKILLVTVILLPTLIILAITASIGIGYVLGNMFYGFLIISVLFVFILLLVYLFRHKLDKTLLKMFSNNYFD